MPLFITPMTKAPMTAPVTLPTPPVAEAPPMNTAAITSSSKPRPAFGRRGVEARGEDQAGKPRQHAHVDEGEEGQALGLDAGQLGRLLVAAQRIDAPADRGAVGHEGIERDQHRHDDEDVRQAAIGGQQIAESDHEHGQQRRS